MWLREISHEVAFKNFGEEMIMNKFIVAALALVGLALSYPSLSQAQVGNWVVLGNQTVLKIKPDQIGRAHV